jgi:cyclase
MKIITALFALSATVAFAQAPAGDYAHMTMKVEKLAPNFYTITGINGTGRTGGAIGVLTGPEGNFMVDATFAPLAEKVVAAIKTFSNAPVRFLVNTHPHGDHTGGNAYFAKTGTIIMAKTQLRAAMAAQKNVDPAALPIETYNTPVTLHMNGEEIVVIPVPPSHTDGDTMVYFRNSDVLMIGDFFRRGYPNIGGTVDGMLQALGMAIALCGPNTKVVPGHGPVGTRADVIAHRDMLAAVGSRISALVKQGKTEDEVVAARPTANFDAVELKEIAQFYDDGNMTRYHNGDAFVKQVYELMKPKQQ